MVGIFEVHESPMQAASAFVLLKVNITSLHVVASVEIRPDELHIM